MKKLSLNLKGIRYGDTLRPSRDWLTLLLAALALLVLSIVWNLWAFSKVTEGQPIGDEAAPNSTNTAVVDSVTRLFEERRAEEAKYRNEYRFVDPSGGTR